MFSVTVLITISLTADLAASTVKLTGRDVLATWKGLIALAVAPLLYACYALLAALVAKRANVPFKWQLSASLGVFIALPLMNFAALKFGEAGMDVLKCVSSCSSNKT